MTPNGMFFGFKGNSYSSTTAIAAYKASTLVDSGKGAKQQIDHESNYSFDYGSAHFVFLDANPHLFDGVLDGPAVDAAPQLTFPAYPSVLRDWLIHDLDSSAQPWKFVVFHQPAFSSGNAIVRNNQMRAVAKFRGPSRGSTSQSGRGFPRHRPRIENSSGRFGESDQATGTHRGNDAHALRRSRSEIAIDSHLRSWI